MQGWISLHRKFQNNFLWQETRKFSKAEAWIDILMEVQHDKKDQKIMIKNALITCKQGQSIKSLDTWAKRWNWSKSAVRRFFEILKMENMVVIENVKKTTRLTVCNYSTYQTSRNNSEPKVKRKRNASETQLAPDNNGNNGNNENNDNKLLMFDGARVIFGGSKNGNETEFANFQKKHTDWEIVLPLLKPAIENQIIWRQQDQRYWKNFQTWINQRCWEEETSMPNILIPKFQKSEATIRNERRRALGKDATAEEVWEAAR